MRIENLKLSSFRNYLNLELDLNFDLIFIIGSNASGKTSILEAIQLASTLKSFRTTKQQDVISWDNTFYTINIKFRDNLVYNNLHIGYGSLEDHKVNRILRINKERVDKISKFIGKFQTVVFAPQDTNIIDTTPKERRRFIDIVLSSVSPYYLENLQKYQKTLKMRSTLLKDAKNIEKINKSYISAIDIDLIESGSFIQKKRSDFINEFQVPFTNYVSLISNKKDNWKIQYTPSILEGENQIIYKKELENSLENDIRLSQTTKGIHRDRIFFFPLNKVKKDLQEIASQGQKRTVALALKMSQFIYTKNVTHQTPILLIDDVLNELDIDRRTSFIQFLKEIGQALITTTDLSGLEKFIEEKKKSNNIAIYKTIPDKQPILEKTNETL